MGDQMPLNKDATWRRLPALAWAVIGGSGLVLAPIMAFGLRLDPGPSITTLHSTGLALCLVTGALASARAAILVARQRKKGFEVAQVLFVSAFISLGLFILALAPDPMPFIATMTSAGMSLGLAWLFSVKRHLRPNPTPADGAKIDKGDKQVESTVAQESGQADDGRDPSSSEQKAPEEPVGVTTAVGREPNLAEVP